MISILPPYIPSPNDQRDDPAWLDKNFKINGNSQCQGNLRDDMVRAVAIEFDIPELKKISTFNYYSMFNAYFKDLKNKAATRLDLMSFKNHDWFMNELFFNNKVSVKTVTKTGLITIDDIHEALKRTNRIVGLHGYFSRDGHAIRVNGMVADKVDVNDPYGFHPYDKIKKGGRFIYSKEKIMSVKPYRLVTLENK